MFEQTVANAINDEQAHSIRVAQRFGPAGDAIQHARRRPIRGFARRVITRVTHRRPAPPYRPAESGSPNTSPTTYPVTQT